MCNVNYATHVPINKKMLMMFTSRLYDLVIGTSNFSLEPKEQKSSGSNLRISPELIRRVFLVNSIFISFFFHFSFILHQMSYIA